MSGHPTPESAVVLLRIDREASRHTTHPRHLHPPLDLKYMQAALTAQLDTAPRLLDGWLTPFSVAACVAETSALAPRIAIIRAVSWCLDESLAVATALKKLGIITMAVGQQVAHHRRLPLVGWDEAYDLAIDGEPEARAPLLVAKILAGLTHGATAGEVVAGLRNPGTTMLTPMITAQVDAPDTLPPPRYTREELASYPFPYPLPRMPALHRFGYVLTAWGCPRPCRHCTAIVRRSVGRPLRPRSITAVIDEVAALADTGAQAIFFDDDSLFVHKTRLLELAETLVRRGLTLPWVANARPDELDAERVAAAKAAGAVLLKVGVETGSPRMIESIGKSNNGERWIAATEAAFALLKQHQIGSVGLFMVGLPGETVADANATRQLALHLKPDYLQVQGFRAYPDIDWWPDLPAAMRTAHAASNYHYLAASENCSQIPDQLLAVLPGQIYRSFYLNPDFIGRHLHRNWRHYSSPSGLRNSALALAYLLGLKRKV